MVTWDRRRSGSKPPLLVSRALRWLWSGSERRWNPRSSKVPALHREAERDTTGSFSRQPLVHTWIGPLVQGKRRSAATLDLIHRNCVKLRLTLWFYSGKRAARRHGFLASRANHRVLLGCALVCAAALLWSDATAVGAVEGQSASPGAGSNFPVASDARLAGDGKQTRFILDLDKKIAFRAFPLADPYRIVVDIPQVNFQLPAGAGATGRGLIKAFRYGLVMPGGSRIVFDLTGPAKIANSYVLDAANGQPSRLVLEIEEVDRAAFNQAAAAENKPDLRPAIASVNTAAPTDT